MFSKILNYCMSLWASMVRHLSGQTTDQEVLTLQEARRDVEIRMRNAGNLTLDQLRDFVWDIEKIEGRMSL